MPTAKVIDLRAASSKPARRKLIIKIVAGCIGVATIIGASWLTWHHWFQKPNLGDVKVVTRLVARHIVLPTGEDPALATITDASKLQTPFLKQAHNGDKLLIYEKSGLVVIYRPSIDRIIGTGPVSIQPTSPGS